MRARTPRAPRAIKTLHENAIFYDFQYIRTSTARSARTYGACQSIFLIQEILFDYLIATAAQKLTDLAQIEVRAKLFKNGDQEDDQ